MVIRRKSVLCAALSLSLFLFSGCAPQACEPPSASSQPASPYVSRVLVPQADGKVRYETELSALDASHAADGYVMAAYFGKASRAKLLIDCPTGASYQYDLRLSGEFDAFPLTEGPGDYRFSTYENVENDQYAPDLSQMIHVDPLDEFGPYLYPNQYVSFTESSAVAVKGAELAKTAADDLEVLQNVYSYVVENITYDREKADTVKSGYIPEPDSVLASGTGICFDYAAVMAAMLRSVGIPAQLQVGYMGTVYHAWISTHIQGMGWVNGVIQFDGEKWTMMDPTTAASRGEQETAEFLNTKGSYSVKFKY